MIDPTRLSLALATAKPNAESALEGGNEKPAVQGGEVTFGGHVHVAVVAKHG